MAISLYDATVSSFLRTLNATAAFMEKGAVFCQDGNTDPNALVDCRIIEDMLPLQFQIRSIYHHSAGAIEGAKSGNFAPPAELSLPDYRALQNHVADAITTLEQVKPDEINSLEGGEVIFRIPNMELPFTTENFLLGFSIPNFFFHVTTAYDLLRMNGVPIGKLDFIGAMPLKQ